MKLHKNQALLALLCFMAFTTMRGMGGNTLEWMKEQLMYLPGIVIGLSFHEFAHAKVAYVLGDITPKLQGRLTINPMAHIEPFGFITIFMAGFGWGRAVAINPSNFKNRRRDEFLVSIAGVTMNLIIAISFSLILRGLISYFGYSLYLSDSLLLIVKLIVATIHINIVLMVFNLLPIPPLDGFSIITQIFKLDKYQWYWPVYSNGLMLLMIMVITGVTGRIMSPIIQMIMEAMQEISGLI